VSYFIQQFINPVCDFVALMSLFTMTASRVTQGSFAPAFSQNST
jgi:hypothetical protein